MARCSLILALAVVGCSRAGRPPLLADAVARPADLPLVNQDGASAREAARREAVYQSQRYLSGAPLRAGGYDFSADAAGFVRAAYWSAGVELLVRDAGGSDDLEILYRSAAARRALHRATPRRGDLVFFDADLHGDGSEAPKGVAIVEDIRRDGTVVAIGSFADGPRRIALNLAHPLEEMSPDGTRRNDRLRGATIATAAQLFRSYATPF